MLPSPLRFAIYACLLVLLSGCGSSAQEDLTPEGLDDEVAFWKEIYRQVAYGERGEFDLVEMALSLGMNHRRALLYYHLDNYGDTEILIPVLSRGLRVVTYDTSEGECDAIMQDLAARFDLELYKTYYLAEHRRQVYLLSHPISMTWRTRRR